VKGIQVCSNQGDIPSPRGDNSESKNALEKLNLFLQNQIAKFNQTWYTLFLGKGNSGLFK
jgi:hypothetical protein